jgi:hypothetical protein
MKPLPALALLATIALLPTVAKADNAGNASSCSLGDPHAQLPPVIAYPSEAPLPIGYRRESRLRMGLVYGGIASFLFAYTTSLIYGLARCGACGEILAPTVVPIVGPFAYRGSDAVGESFLFVTNGLVEAGALFMIASGLIFQRSIIAREVSASGIRLTPIVGDGLRGVALGGRF